MYIFFKKYVMDRYVYHDYFQRNLHLLVSRVVVNIAAENSI